MAKVRKERAERMVDFSIEDAEVTFDLGKPVTEEDRERLRELLKEQEQD